MNAQTTDEIRDSVQRLVDYNWQDEQRDYEGGSWEGPIEGHIFFHIMRLQDWLEASPRGPRTRCACGRELDENGEHDGGYGAWCG